MVGWWFCRLIINVSLEVVRGYFLKEVGELRLGVSLLDEFKFEFCEKFILMVCDSFLVDGFGVW